MSNNLINKQANETNKKVSKDELQIAYKHKKKWPTSQTLEKYKSKLY